MLSNMDLPIFIKVKSRDKNNFHIIRLDLITGVRPYSSHRDEVASAISVNEEGKSTDYYSRNSVSEIWDIIEEARVKNEIR